MTARNSTLGSPVARVREGTGNWGLPRRPGSRQRGRKAVTGSTDLCRAPGSTPFTSVTLSLSGFLHLRIQCIKKALSSAQNMPNSRIVSPTEPLVFLFLTPLLSLCNSSFFLKRQFLLFISWPAPTSVISLNITSSRKPSETGLGSSWCLDFPLQSRPWPFPPPSYFSGFHMGQG